MTLTELTNAKTVLIACQPCGCVAAFALDTGPGKRAELEAEGYTVTEHTRAEGQPLWDTARATCAHGTTQTQLAAKVKELEAIIAQASGKGVTGTCGVLVDPDGSLPRLIIYTTQARIKAFGRELNGKWVEVRPAKPAPLPA